jgi:hypothetical protein
MIRLSGVWLAASMSLAAVSPVAAKIPVGTDRYQVILEAKLPADSPLMKDPAYKTQAYAGLALMYRYKAFHVAWIPLWPYDGAFWISVDAPPLGTTPPEVAAKTGIPESEIHVPFTYRFPVAWWPLLILLGLMVIGAIGQALEKVRGGRKTSASPGTG